MYKTILVPVDLSNVQAGKAMVEVAKSIGSEGAQIILVHVVEDIPAYVAVELPTGLIANARKKAQETLEEIVRETGVDASVEVRSGPAYRTILAAAEEHKADLIVVASHQPGLQDILIGSTAARIVRHAKCAVLVER